MRGERLDGCCRNGHPKTPEAWKQVGNTGFRCIICKRAGEPERKLRTRYGITFDDKSRMLAEQNNRCAICQCEFSDECKPELDHCHRTGKNRKWLCHACNVMLGQAKDDVGILLAAVEYLRHYADELAG